jgi:hypothetical protein
VTVRCSESIDKDNIRVTVRSHTTTETGDFTGPQTCANCIQKATIYAPEDLFSRNQYYLQFTFAPIYSIINKFKVLYFYIPISSDISLFKGDKSFFCYITIHIFMCWWGLSGVRYDVNFAALFSFRGCGLAQE